ncbi:MAG: right-handed parallel beta-helix repeat-containing protein [Thiolinea sp.]
MGSSVYGLCAREVYEARGSIRRLKSKFTVFDGSGEPPAQGEPGSWSPWLVHVREEDSVRTPAILKHRQNGNTAAAVNAEQARDAEIRQYNAAVDHLQHNLTVLRDLENSGEVFRASENVAHEFRYVIDEDVQKYYCMEQRSLAGSISAVGRSDDCRIDFVGPKRIELFDNQTDAVRIQTSNVRVHNIGITDQRNYYDIGHRDGVQLIPPNLMSGDRIIADRMAGSVISDITVDSCTVDAPDARLQGIFCSDGFCRNLSITNNRIRTAAGHFISIAGVLDGCRITNNILQQASDIRPQIKLFPGRLGGNMADDGLVYVLSFSGNSEFRYGAVETFGNQYIGRDQQVLPDQFSDERDRIPLGHERVALGLRNFNYDRYMAMYSQWTVADYKSDDPVGFRRLKAWLEQRVTEYSTGKRTELDQANNPILPEPSVEQKTRVLGQLQQALNLLNSGGEAFLSTRLADLQAMPVRSFIIKRLAVRAGDIVLDGQLGAGDLARRDAQLKWFLADELPVDNQGAATAVADVRPQVLPKNYSALKIMAAPLEVPQGKLITFSVNEADYLRPGERAGYFWTVTGKTGNTPEFAVDTRNWSEGEHRVRATLYAKPLGGGTARQVAGSAVFRITAPEAFTESVGLESPLRAFGSLKEHIRVNQAKLTGGQKLVVSLDQSFLEEQLNGAKLRYFWSVSGRPNGQGATYEVDTTGLTPGDCLVRVTVHRTDLETNKYKQFTGLAVVEVREVSVPA